MILNPTRIMPAGRFARSVSVLVGGSAFGQLIVLLASPALTRLYTPDDFGILAVYSALLMILSVFSTLRYHLAIPLCRKDIEAVHLLGLSLIVVCSISLIVVALTLIFGETLARALNVPDLGPLLWFLPAGVALLGVYQVFNHWALRTKSFGAISKTRILQAMAMVTVQIGGFTFGAVSLLLGHIASQSVGIGRLARLVPRQKSTNRSSITINGIIRVANRYRKFPLYSTWGGFANTVSRQLPSLVLAGFFSPVAAGLYLLAQRVLGTPVSLVGKAVNDTLLSHGPNAQRNDTLSLIVNRIHAYLAKVGMPATAIIAIFGPWFFSFVFGEEWHSAGEFARYLAPALYMQFLSLPLAAVFTILERPNLTLVCNLFLLFLRLAALAIGVILGDLYLSVGLFGGAGFLGYFLFSTTSGVYSGVRISTLLFNHLVAMAYTTLIIAVPLGLIYIFDIGNAVVFTVSIAIATIYYLWLFRDGNLKISTALV